MKPLDCLGSTVSGHGTERRRTEVLWSNRCISAPHLFSGVTA